MNWISLDELIFIHYKVIETTGGVQGILNPGALESVLIRPFTSFGGTDAFPSREAKIAALIDGIIAFHPFVDGNKRTAFEAADICFRRNGNRIFPSDQVAEFFWSIARGERSLDDIREWLKSNTEPWTDSD